MYGNQWAWCPEHQKKYAPGDEPRYLRCSTCGIETLWAPGNGRQMGYADSLAEALTSLLRDLERLSVDQDSDPRAWREASLAIVRDAVSKALKNGGRAKQEGEGFAEFWAAYPRRCPRRNRSQAEKAWRKHKPDLRRVLDALAWQDAEYPDWQCDGGRFIEAPAVWINQHGWEREMPHRDINPTVNPHASGTEEWWAWRRANPPQAKI